MRCLLACSFLCVSLAAQAHPGRSERLRAEAEARLAAKRMKDAVASAQAAVEADPRDLTNLRLLATVAAAANDNDLAVWALHAWRAAARGVRNLPSKFSQEVEKELGKLDKDFRTWGNLEATYLRYLTGAAKTAGRRNPDVALAVQHDILRLDPGNAAATKEVAAATTAEPAPAGSARANLQAQVLARPDDVALRTRFAQALTELGDAPAAASAWRSVLRELALAGQTESPAGLDALARWRASDGGEARYGKARSAFVDGGMALARRYEAGSMPRMALGTALALSDGLGDPGAFAYALELAERGTPLPCAWRCLYDERALDGWAANAAFTAAGESIVAQVAGDLPPPRPTGVNVPLAADEPFEPKVPVEVLLLEAEPEGDYSFEASLRIAADGRGGFHGTRAGLCFGARDAGHLTAVWVTPDDVLDFATRDGEAWQPLLHRPWMVGNHWLRLRLDVIGARVDVFCDGALVHTQELPARARGRVGLLAGTGATSFRAVRLLDRSQESAGARLERALATRRRAVGNGTRQPGSFLGVEPPVLQPRGWIQGEPVTLGDMRGRPVILAFWSVDQDRAIPCTRLFNSLVERGKAKGVDVGLIVFCDGGSEDATVQAYLANNQMPTAHVAADDGNLTLGAYGIKGLPMILLLDAAGRTVFQGSASLERSNGWSGGSTELDAPFAALLVR